MTQDDGLVQRALRSVIRDHGWRVTENAGRLRATLSDVLGVDAADRRSAVDALVIAAEHGVPEAARDPSTPSQDLVARLETWGLDPEIAAWAVSVWQSAGSTRTEAPAATDPSPARLTDRVTMTPQRPVVPMPVQQLEATAMPPAPAQMAAAPRSAPEPVPPAGIQAARSLGKLRMVLLGATAAVLVLSAGALAAARLSGTHDATRPNAASHGSATPPATGAELVSDPAAEPRTLHPPVGMAAKHVGISLTGLSYVNEMHVGGRTLAPPQGGRLIAFQVDHWDCQAHESCGPGRRVRVEVNGEPRPLRAGGPYVLAVPAGTLSADLVMRADGTTQRISLLTGRPAIGNIAALGRAHRTVGVHRHFDLNEKTSIPIYYIDGHEGAYNHALNVTISDLSLNYWVAGKTPHDTQHAFMAVNAWYTRHEDPQKSHRWAFDEPLLTFVANGEVYHARDLTAPKSYATQVFEVPADISRGRLVLGGPQRVFKMATNGNRFSVGLERHVERVRF